MTLTFESADDQKGKIQFKLAPVFSCVRERQIPSYFNSRRDTEHHESMHLLQLYALYKKNILPVVSNHLSHFLLYLLPLAGKVTRIAETVKGRGDTGYSSFNCFQYHSQY